MLTLILGINFIPVFVVVAPSSYESSSNTIIINSPTNFWLADNNLFWKHDNIERVVVTGYIIRSAKVLDYRGLHLVFEDISKRTSKSYYTKLVDISSNTWIRPLELSGGFPELVVINKELYVITKSLLGEHVYISKDLGDSFSEFSNSLRLETQNAIYAEEVTIVNKNSALSPAVVTETAKVSASKATANWTFMVYLDGDCDLEDAAIDDFNEMAVAGSTDEAHIIVQFDRISGYDTTNGDWTTCKRFRITQGMTPTPGNELSDIGEPNMGDPNVLIDFVKWGIQNYPAKYYTVTLWDHGGGWKGGVCIDSTSSDRLYPDELKYAFEELRKFLGRPLDIVGYDACLMAESGVYYEHWHTADYIVGSEETEGWDGWIYGQQSADADSNYPGICEALKQWPNMTPAEFGRVIVERNIVTPSIDTFSCIDSTKFNYPAAEQFQNLSQKLRHVTNTYNSQITTARDNAQSFYYSYMKDLWHLTKLLKDNVPDSEVQGAAEKLMDYYNQSVVKNGNVGGSYANAYGLTVYFDTSYDSGYDALSIAKENMWDEFLEAYFANVSYPNKEPVCTITEPAQGSTVYKTAPITIKGTASDPADGGTIESVQVKIDREFWVNATGTTNWELTWDPANASEGVHTIFARSFDSNDFSPWAVCEVYVAVDPNLPDLTVENITFSNATPYEGDIVVINATVKNVGINWSAYSVNVSFYSGDPKAGGITISTVNVGDIAIGESKLASTSWDTTGFVGLNNIYVKADSTDTIAETNELNNTANKPITVQGYRIELSCPTNKSKVRAGATATYNIKVKNLGTFTDTIILNLTNTNASWTANLSAESVTLDANSETTVYLNVTAPKDALPDANVTVYVNGTSQGDTKKTSNISTLTIVIPKILLVDDESGTDEQYYMAALNASGYKYDYTPPEQITGWSSVLLQYKIVIWFTAGTATLSDFDKQNLQFYLDGGGLLLICGEDIGYDIAGDADKFYQNYLHATYIADNSGIKNLSGISGDPISDGFDNIPITGSYPSEIAPYDSYGTKVFIYTGSTKIAAIKVDTGVYRLVYIACEYFEGTDIAANKSTIMDRIIKWLEPLNDVALKSIDSLVDGEKYPAGVQYINATVINKGRADQSNFNVSCKIEEIVEPAQTTTIFSDSFESWPGTWSIEPSGKWVQSSDYANTGSYSAKALYDAHNVDYTLTSQNVDLSGVTNANFQYYFRGSSENNYDYLYVEIKRTTETTWTTLTKYTGTSYNTSWNNANFDISSYGGSTVQIRFRFHTDGSVIDGIGWYVDDVAITKTTPPVTQIVFDSNHTVTKNLVQDATVQVSWSYNFQNASDYIITVRTWLTTDESKLNDAKSITIKIVATFTFNLKQGWNFITLPLNTTYKTAGELASAIPYCQYVRKWDSATQSYITYEKGTFTTFNDSFESWPGTWSIEPSGKWVQSSDYANTGSYSAKVLYDAHNVDYNLTSQNVDLSGATNANLKYYFRGSSENNYDYLYVEIKRTTETTWTELTKYTGTNYNTSWNNANFDISSYAGSTVQIRFRFHTDGSVIDGIGWYVDDVVIEPLNNFTLELGVGYFVYVTQATDFNIEGTTLTKQTLTLSKGWNSIGRFNETAIYASDLAKSIGSNCTAVAYYDEALGRFVTHVVGTDLSNFKILRAKGYLVYVVGATGWKNE
ncbi:MAG: clostripain-related cysteine peptidase [Candidatus Thermoplasmatota archaeon]